MANNNQLSEQMGKALNIKREFSVERRAVAATDMIEFVVPMPPSLNGLFANVPGKGRIKSARYRAWIKEAGWEIASKRLGRIFGPVTLTMTLSDKSRMDTDNALKAICDLCTRHGLIEDDAGKIVRGLSVSFGPVQGAKVVIARAG